jgi:PST family polysaccharide transporter
VSVLDVNQADRPQHLTADPRRLFDNIVSLYLLQGLNYLLPLAVLPYLVRVLGIETYGLVAVAQSFAQYFNILTDYGFNFSATRSIAQSKDQPGHISRIFCCVFLIKICLTAVGLILLVCVLLTVSRMRHDWPIFIYAFVGVVGNVLFPVWYFQGLERMRHISIISGATKALSAVLLFVFVHHSSDGTLAVAIQSLGMLLAGAIGFVVCTRSADLDFEWPRWHELRTCSAEGWHLFVSTASISLYSNTNVFLVGMLAGNVQAGYFGAADRLVRASNGLLGPVTQAVFPYVSSLALRSPQAALVFIARSLKWMSGLALLPVIAIFVFARPVTVLCFGHAAEGAVPVMRWIALLPFLVAVTSVLGVLTMLTFGLDKQFSRILIAAGILNVAVAVPLISTFAAEGAGASVLLTETFVTVMMGFILRQRGINIRLWEKVAV